MHAVPDGAPIAARLVAEGYVRTEPVWRLWRDALDGHPGAVPQAWILAAADAWLGAQSESLSFVSQEAAHA